MNKASRQFKPAVILFSLTMICFLLFFCAIGSGEKATVYHAEDTHHYMVLSGMEPELVTDNALPAAVQKIYRGTLPQEASSESCLCFNISHHHIQVYFDNILMYSLSGAENNPLGQNVGSNWCSVHVGQQHAGKSVTVVLTPLFEAAIGKEPVFLLGSHYAIAMELLIGELPLLILSVLCILVGLFVFAVFLYFHYIVKVDADGMNYLGLFSAAMGLWKLMDLKCMSLLFPTQVIVMNYTSIGALFLAALCLMTYFGTLFVKQRQRFMRILSCIACVVCLIVLGLQVLGVSEFRQNLICSHILLIGAIVSLPLITLYNRIVHKNSGLNRSWKLLLMLPVGISLDLILYYRNNGNGLMSFSIISFIVYTLVIFLNSVQDATRKAYTDSHTGLVNRGRWNELMDDRIPLAEPYGILMIDLNGLKRVNDTLGHDAGDQMIFRFSNILQNTLPHSSVICRWGGDEFSALLTGVSRIQLDDHIYALNCATKEYNTANPDLPIHFAIGASLSTEHPSMIRAKLFQLADEEMYRNKQLWYRQKQTNV